MKRELAFALQTYSQLNLSPGRTRSSKTQADNNNTESTRKRPKNSSKARSNINVDKVDANLLKKNKNTESSASTPTKKLEMKMSKKIELSKIPRTVKELLATGLLEGYPVTYNGSTQGPPLQALIKDAGIMCLCSSCVGSKVLRPCPLKFHACDSYRRAAQDICLENGTSLSDVVKACRQSCLESLDDTIRQLAGPLPVKESTTCPSCNDAEIVEHVAADAGIVELGARKAEIGESVATDAKYAGDAANDTKIVESVATDAKIVEHVATDAEIVEHVATDAEIVEHNKLSVSTEDSNDSILIGASRSLQPVLALRRSGRKASEDISYQDISEDNTAEDSIQKSALGLRRSSRNGISLPDGGQGKKRKDRSLKLDMSPQFSGSISDLLMEENTSQMILQKPSKAVLGSRIPKSSSVSTLSLSSQQKIKSKITKKDQRLHKMVFEEGGLPDGTVVAYYSDGKKCNEGFKKGSGIYCRHCDSVVSASTFEAHAGHATRRKPYNYIYTSNGVSLHEFSVSLLKNRRCSAKDNDDLCTICADGGDLLLCDGCPRAFHRECTSVSSVPHGKWFCQWCRDMFVRDRFVECNANALAAGRVAGVDLIEQITKRCVRIVKSSEDEEVIACILCRGYDFSTTGFGPKTVIVCDQCEKEYHIGCLKEHNMADLKELPEGNWFCCNDCTRISSDLQSLLHRGEEYIHDSYLKAIKQKNEDKVSDSVPSFKVKWRVLNGKIASTENRSLLSKAVSIFHENFDPIIDSETGLDYIPSMVYGRSISTQGFTGMYCAILTVNSSIVSAALFRVFGQELAELPLVATSSCHQGKGFFQLLFSCIEKLLAYLNVKNLVLPAAPEAESIWTDKFAFKKMDSEKLKDFRKICWQMLTFEGTCMLEKVVPGLSLIQKEIIDAGLKEW